MEKLAEFKALLASPKKIVILPHRKPDADALGSCLALYQLLLKLDHEATVLSPTDYPNFLHWMPHNDEVVVYDGNELEGASMLKGADIVCCLDFSDLGRVDSMSPALRNVREAGNNQFVMIDHHRGKEDFADFELWDIEAPATAQLIYELIELMGWQELMDLDIAACLYAGILTDTGSFKYPSTSARTHQITAKLMDAGLKPAYIHRKIFDNNSLNRIKFLGFALNERLTILPEYKTAFFAISKKDLRNFESQTGDTEGIVNYALSIEGVVLAAFFSQHDHKVKISFRSIGSFPVNEMAAEHFRGGGHKNAAGGQLNATLRKAVDKFTDLLPSYKEALLNSEEEK